jgi:hypothetical protein
MARDPGNTRSTARTIEASSTTRGSLNPRDRFDLYRFDLAQKSSFNLSLGGKLKANVNVVLLDDQLNLVGRSALRGRRAENINTTLEQGRYYARVIRVNGKTSTNYRLTLVAIPIGTGGDNNTLPTLATNVVGSVGKGSSLTISNSLLSVTDDQQGAAELTYTLDAAPQNGTLQLNGKVLFAGDRFTQADIDANLLSYSSTPGGSRLLSNTGSLPQLSGTNAVWVDASNGKIAFYNGSTTIALPGDYGGAGLGISGSNVAWVGLDSSGTDTEIFFYDGSTGTTTQLTQDDFNQFGSEISGSTVAWVGRDQNDTEIFIRKPIDNAGTFQTFQLTNNESDDFQLRLAGSNLGWYHGTTQIWYHDAGSRTGIVNQLVTTTNNTTAETSAESGSLQVSADGLIWAARDGGDSEIYRYRGDELISFVQLDDNNFRANVSTIGSATRLTNNDVHDFSPQVSGAWVSSINLKNEIFYDDPNLGLQQLTSSNTSNFFSRPTSGLTWTRFDGNDTDIVYYDLTNRTVVPLTVNNTPDEFLADSGPNIFWSGVDASTNTNEIFYFDGSKKSDGSPNITQLTTNDGIDRYLLRASGANVSWLDATSDSGIGPIFYSNIAKSDSFDGTVSDGAGGSVKLTFNIALV